MLGSRSKNGLLREGRPACFANPERPAMLLDILNFEAWALCNIRACRSACEPAGHQPAVHSLAKGLPAVLSMESFEACRQETH